jgi:hypothetical protein
MLEPARFGTKEGEIMATDSFFALTCTASLGLLFGFILAFAGYRFFIFLLPFWGFFFGFGLGAQAVQALFNSGFLADVSSWVVGFFVGLVFAVISYIFFAGAVAVIAGSLGYSLGVGVMLAIGFDQGILTWIVGIALSIIFIIGTFYLSLYKWVIIIATSILGAEVITGVFLFILGKTPTADFVRNPVKAALNDNPFWLIVGIVIAVLGFLVQVQTTRYWTLREYNRWGEVYPTEEGMDTSSSTATSGMAPAMAAASPAGGTSTMATPPAAPPPTPPADVPPAPMADMPTDTEPPTDGTA